MTFLELTLQSLSEKKIEPILSGASDIFVSLDQDLWSAFRRIILRFQEGSVRPLYMHGSTQVQYKSNKTPI